MMARDTLGFVNNLQPMEDGMQIILIRSPAITKTYRCWHYLCRETAKLITAPSSFAARKELAAELDVDMTDIVATTGE